MAGSDRDNDDGTTVALHFPTKSELKLNDSFKERLLMENKSILDENIGNESSAAENNSNKNLGDKINKKLMAQ